jgi:hypothetical protein
MNTFILSHAATSRETSNTAPARCSGWLSRIFRCESLSMFLGSPNLLFVQFTGRFQLRFSAAPHAQEVLDEDGVSEMPVIQRVLGDACDVADMAVDFARRRIDASHANFGVERDSWLNVHAGSLVIKSTGAGALARAQALYSKRIATMPSFLVKQL